MKKAVRRVCAVLLALAISISTTDLSVFAAEGSALQATEVTTNTISEGNSILVEGSVSTGDSMMEDKLQDDWDGITTENVYEAENYKVIFNLTASWESGYSATLRIENTGDKIIENWSLSHDFQNTILSIWDAEIYNQETGRYIIKNAGWNADIPIGGYVEFGIVGNEKFLGFPSKYDLLSRSIETNKEDYMVEYTLEGDWGSGFTGKISIINNTNTIIEDWVIEFDFDRTITSVWNGVIETCEGNHYIVRNSEYNANIQPGQSVTIGLKGEGGETDDVPYEYRLYTYGMGDAEQGEMEQDADTDQDGAPDYVEEYFGTDTTKEDTDGDGLSDYIELFSLVLDPRSIDTDSNGITDAEEDTDSDGLSNIREIEIGTSILKIDTDRDGLTDYEEDTIYGTVPMKEDTDGDGVSDGKEVEFGTNPLVYEKAFAMHVEADNEDTVKVSVETTLSGEQAETLSVEKYENEFFFPETMPGYIGGAYDFKVDGSFDIATIRFEFDADLLEDATFNPVVYYFNEETQLLEALETTVTGNVASAQVSHFSKYILLNRTVYEDAFTWEDVWSTNGYTGVEIVLVIDDSGSMSSNDRWNQRLTVAQNLIDNLPESSKIGIVKFASATSILTSALIDDKEEAKSYLTTTYFRSSGGTYMYRAMNSAFSLFEAIDDDTLKMMVVLSDGATGDTNLHTSIINTANEKNIKIYTIGLGSSTSYFTRYLKPLAEDTDGVFYLAANASQLTEIYSDISKKVEIETDSDADGIADYYEENMVMFNGITIQLDKNNPDSDGDGLLDGEEVVELNYQYNTDKTQVIVTGKILSNPVEADTDGDGITDEEEIYYYETNPLLKDTDGDGLDDGTEIDNWYDPLEVDADGDGRLDLQEYEEGTSPYSYDKEWYEHVWDFICGFVAGDFIRDTDSFATMAGQITSGFHPVADIRDVIGNLAHNDYVFAGISAIGLAPILGDSTKAIGKVSKFILKNLDNLPEVAKIFEFLCKNCPDLLVKLGKNDEFIEAVEQMIKSDASKLTKQEFDAINEALEKAGFPKEIRVGAKISSEINMDKIYEHVFSQDHINGGIMKLGGSESEIINKFFDIAEATSGKWVEGSNEIHTLIDGVEVTIRIFIVKGQIRNLNGFVGYSERVIGNLILY